jgi:hypothetical protein
MPQSSTQSISPRLGFHYFPDTLHYREQDLQTWLPELISLGAAWLTLLAPLERSIPEFFLSGLMSSGVQPVLHFPAHVGQMPDLRELRTLLEHYARWGVKYVALYDRPNSRANWQPPLWAQEDLVERFLDLFLPQAEMVREVGLVPLFPPLEPGGDYWDLAFLSTALRSIQRRGFDSLLERLVLGAYGLNENHPPEWGKGGAARWPEARPYITPPGSQDQRGFYIFDWYLETSREELGDSLPILLLRAGNCAPSEQDGAPGDGMQHALHNLTLARMLSGDAQDGPAPEAVATELLACNFWLLAAGEADPRVGQAWFKPDGSNLPAVDVFRHWVARKRPLDSTVEPPPTHEMHVPEGEGFQDETQDRLLNRSIDHYVLLPLYAWGAADWDLAAIQPLLQEGHPTIGFSLAEARLAARVTLVGGEGAVSAGALAMLQSAGCRVERLLEDGTLVAT